MITCKEDLINTAVFCHKGELRELYLEKCREFGIEWLHTTLNIDSYQLLRVDEDGRLQGVKTETGDHYNSAKRLTLSDLKPRTKVEYEKCKHKSAWEVIKEHEESGNLFICEHADDEVFNSDYPVCGYDMACIKDAILSEIIYRKVERPVEWFDDVLEYLEQNRQSGSCDEQGVLSVGADMTRDQWCDFARIILEQEGE